ncbi:MAG: hypothetical protein JWM32_1222 [Verrucomicrobia bacterium]|nr:hypothetical protein [Verrucomicrobiota bacterium]
MSARKYSVMGLMSSSRFLFGRRAWVWLIGLAPLLSLRGADDIATQVIPDLPPAWVAWNQSEAARGFRASIEKFTKKVSATSRLAFEIPRLGIDMIFVPPGKFEMGEDGSEEDEHPETAVTITRGFWLGRFEITQEEWKYVMEANPRLTKFELNPSTYKGAQRPVEFISWKAANEFCKYVNDREYNAGRLPRGYVYRLPTEAEWEHACRLGLKENNLGVRPNTGWYNVTPKEGTHPVGQKSADLLGLHDMFGNVAEWCSDWFGTYVGKPVADPVGPEKGDFRVARGGCWNDIAYGCRPGYRSGAEDIVRSAGIGMRLALAPEIK